jgi:tRNA threonylcarbamoyladenosine biosynthesis protein TsaB
MNIFINAITQNGVLILFDENKKIISKREIEIMWNESSKLTTLIDIFLKENNVWYFDLQNIVVVNWPWSFTWVRTVILAINTINFIINKNITNIDFFGLFKNYPIIKSSSRRDLFVKYEKSDNIIIVKNEDLVWEWEIYWDLNNNTLSEKINVISEIDYKEIIENIILQENKLVKPLYIKKPNIS